MWDLLQRQPNFICPYYYYYHYSPYLQFPLILFTTKNKSFSQISLHELFILPVTFIKGGNFFICASEFQFRPRIGGVLRFLLALVNQVLKKKDLRILWLFHSQKEK